MADSKPLMPNRTNTPAPYKSTALTLLGYGRAGLGVLVFVAPQTILPLFRLETTSSTLVLARFFAVREFTVGAISLATNNDGHRSTIEKVLWMNVCTDSLDVVGCAIGYFSAAVEPMTALMHGATAVAVALVGDWGLWSFWKSN